MAMVQQGDGGLIFRRIMRDGTDVERLRQVAYRCGGRRMWIMHDGVFRAHYWHAAVWLLAQVLACAAIRSASAAMLRCWACTSSA